MKRTLPLDCDVDSDDGSHIAKTEMADINVVKNNVLSRPMRSAAYPITIFPNAFAALEIAMKLADEACEYPSVRAKEAKKNTGV